MTKEQKLECLKERFHKLSSNGKNPEDSGVLRKIKRKIRQLEQ